MALFLLTVVFIGTILAGMPIAFGVGLAALIALIAQGESLVILSHQMFFGVDSFTLGAIPMFVLAGEIMFRGQLTKALTDVSDIIVGRIRGGLGHTNILASMFFAGITGSATADTTAIGSLLIPAMKQKGYSASYSTAVTIASSVIGPIIPPSLTFVIYALAVGRTSIGALFLAGILPGTLTVIALMILHYYFSVKRQYEKRTEPYTWPQILVIVKRCMVVAFMPIIVVIGVTTGIFTATESAAVASAYAFVICFVVFRTLSFKDFPSIIFQTAKVSSLIVLLLATSTVFSYVLATENVPVKVGDFLQTISTNKYVFLLIVNVALLLIGCIIDTFPAILIFAPIFVPIAKSYGIDPLHFGVVFCVNLLIGLNTPPVGTGLFIGSAIGKVSIEELMREVLPFTAVQLVVLVLLTYFPWFTVTIPKLAGF